MMKKMRKDIIVAYAVLIISALVFAWTTLSLITNANAEPSYRSDEFQPDFDMYHIGVTLNENGEQKAWRNYLQEGGDGDTTQGNWHVNGETSLLEDLEYKIGSVHKEELTVSNSGTIDEYVRVTIYKYWTDESGSKDRTLKPELIKLRLVNLDEDHWILDETATTVERTVLYYAYPLTKSDGQYFDKENGTTVPFADQFSIDSTVKTYIRQEKKTETVDDRELTTITSYYQYDGKYFCVDIQVDGVQINNAKDAIRSAWGRDVTIADDGRLSLN